MRTPETIAAVTAALRWSVEPVGKDLASRMIIVECVYLGQKWALHYLAVPSELKIRDAESWFAQLADMQHTIVDELSCR